VAMQQQWEEAHESEKVQRIYRSKCSKS